MADIKDSVDGPGSQVQDIAMIQMMLKVVKDAKGAPYLKVNYSGEWNAETKDAITRFQQDQKLIPPEQPLKGLPDAKLPVTPDAKVAVSPVRDPYSPMGMSPLFVVSVSPPAVEPPLSLQPNTPADNIPAANTQATHIAVVKRIGTPDLCN